MFERVKLRMSLFTEVKISSIWFIIETSIRKEVGRQHCI